jgi:hypothetical protein
VSAAVCVSVLVLGSVAGAMALPVSVYIFCLVAVSTPMPRAVAAAVPVCISVSGTVLRPFWRTVSAPVAGAVSVARGRPVGLGVARAMARLLNGRRGRGGGRSRGCLLCWLWDGAGGDNRRRGRGGGRGRRRACSHLLGQAPACAVGRQVSSHGSGGGCCCSGLLAMTQCGAGYYTVLARR